MDDGELIRALQARLGATLAPAVDPFLGELLLRYLDSPELRALRAWKTERARIAHLHEHLGSERVSRLTYAVVDDYRLTRSREVGHARKGGGGKLTSPATRNREVERLVRVLNWAAERRLCGPNPIAGCRDEEEPTARRTSITSADVDLLRAGALEHGRDHRIGLTLRAMISTKFDAFLRRGELVGLRRSQLDFKTGAIVLDLAETKAHRPGTRITILSERAADDLQAAPRYVGSPWAFTSTRGQRYNPRTFLRMLQAVAADVGIVGAEGENFVAHDLRAGGATEQLELGTPEQDVMDMAGWVTRDMIARYHRRRGANAVARAKARLEKSRGRG